MTDPVMTNTQHSVKVTKVKLINVSHLEFNNFFKVLSALGGSMEGYDIEHAGTCNAAFSYAISRILTLEDTEITAEFIQSFNPHGFLKVWVR